MADLAPYRMICIQQFFAFLVPAVWARQITRILDVPSMRGLGDVLGSCVGEMLLVLQSDYDQCMYVKISSWLL
jgi:hypothetical protein